MELTISLRKPHKAQREILACKSRFVVAACGRRFGKTEIGKRRTVKRAIRGQHGWWLMPTFDMSTKVWDDLKHTLLPIAPYIQIRESERRIKFPGGGEIEVKSTHSGHNLRGAGLDFVVMDEAAFMPPEVWPAIVRPMLLERKGTALFLSTPYGRNWLYDIYQLGLDALEPDWTSFHFTSADNPAIDASELDAIRRNTPERIWREEYMAEFMDDSGAVFRRVREAVYGDMPALEDITAGEFVIGVDLGKINDFTVFVVIDVRSKRVVYIDRMQGEYTLQLMRLKVLCERIQPTNVVIEENVGQMFVEEARRMELPVTAFMTTASSKPPLIEALALAFERGEIGIPNDAVLVRELLAFEMERMTNNIRYSAPSGMHDDTVMALALAWHAVTQSGKHRMSFEFSTDLFDNWG